MSWRFDSREKRLSLRLPAELGGRTYAVALHGGYTFTAAPRAA